MNNYEDLPCSVYLPNNKNAENIFIEEEHQREKVSALKRQEVVSKEPVEESKETFKVANKKSCLTKNAPKNHPSHPALRRKTVAFGRTVNVSQTVEGSSRKDKRMASASNGKQKSSEDEIKQTVRQEMELMRREMMEENEKRQEELNNRNMDRMQDMMGKLMEQFLTQQKSTNKENQSPVPVEHQRYSQPPIANKISIARQIAKKEARLTDDVLPILERRIKSDPVFRQQIDDVLAEAEYEANRSIYSPLAPQSSAKDSRYRNTANSPANALMRETLTVERSIHYDGPVSMDRPWIGEDVPSSNRDRWRNVDEPVHSTYQFGNSISYYPSAADGRQRNGSGNNGYYVEHASDHNDDVIVDAPVERAISENKEEKMRRIREKWSRR